MNCAGRRVFIFLIGITLLFSSCRRNLGWGVLLWAAEDVGIPSCTALPVYIRSNIDKVWVVGVPREFRKGEVTVNKVEIPLSQLHLAGNKGAAKKYANDFQKYALVYAETLQDGLPIREDPDNSARRVYRLRSGEIIKILSPVEGNPAISATGEPLPGEWFRVLTEDGTRGYCFSYRLKLFDHTTGQLASAPVETEEKRDTELEKVLSTNWVAEVYGDMLRTQRLNIEALSKHWGFSTGEDTGIANIYLPGIDQSFSYSGIRAEENNAWRFEGTTLTMRLRSPSVLAVQFVDESGKNTWITGTQKTVLFVSLPTPLDDLIVQEETRRDAKFNKILSEGPVFSSEYYGRFYITEDRDFLWDDFERLVPAVIPLSALGRGKVDMNLFLDNAFENVADGAFTLKFKTIGGPDADVCFLYTIDSGSGLGGLRIEYIPPYCIEDVVVKSRDNSPSIIYFYQSE